MKKHSSILILFLLFFSGFLISGKTDVQANSDGDEIILGYHIEENNVEGKTVYYNDIQYRQIDVSSFNNPWFGNMEHANDNNYVYFRGEYILNRLDPKSYKLGIPGKPEEPPFMYIAYDNDTFCFKGACTQVSNGQDMVFIDEDYSDEPWFRIRDRVYQFKKRNSFTEGDWDKIILIVENADPAHFYFGYHITDTAVYWYGKKIEEADPGSFEVRFEWSNEIATDKNNVYDKGEVLYGADVESFQIYTVYKDGVGHVFSVNENNKDKLIEIFPSESKKLDVALQTAVTEYESKYPGYEPQPAVAPVIFSDIPFTHSLYFQTKRASELGFISGYPDGTFRPDNPVNRAEFAKMLTLAFSKGEGVKDSLERFPDVLFDQWYIPYLSRAVELKIMEGYPDGSMKPANTIIKAEALKMALEAMGGDYGSTASGEQWYEKYRRYAVDRFNLTFLSSEDMPLPMTRGECVELILEALGE